MTSEHWIDLTCHPSTALEAVRAIQVLVRRSASAGLQMTFRLDGDVSQIQVPRAGARRASLPAFGSTPALKSSSRSKGTRPTTSSISLLQGNGRFTLSAPAAMAVLLRTKSMRPNIAVRATDNRLELDALVRLDSLSAIHSDARPPHRTHGGHRGQRWAFLLGAPPFLQQNRIFMTPMASPCCLIHLARTDEPAGRAC